MQSSMLMPAFRRDSFQPYVQQFRWTFKESIDWETFKTAWQRVFKRHDTFFHRFQFSGRGQLIAARGRKLQVRFEEKSWIRFSQSNQRSQLRKFLKEDFISGFHPETDVLCRLTLIRLGGDISELVWTSHHTLFDGRGRLILIREFLAVFESLNQGKRIQLPKAPLYETYQKWVQQQNWDQSKSFWKRKLKDVDDTTPLTFGLDSKPVKTDFVSPTHKSKYFDSAFSDSLHRWSAKSGFSLNTLVQATWGLLLSRTSGKQTVAFAAPRACRKSNIPEAENTVGLFVNTVPVVVRIDDRDTIKKFLTKIRKYWISLRNHENTPLTAIKEWSQIPPNKPMFSSLVGYEKYELNQLIKPGDGGRFQFSLRGYTDLPLVLQLHDGKKIRAEISYDKSQFSSQSIIQIIDSFETILGQLIGNGNRLINSIELLSNSDKQRILKLSTGKRPRLPMQPVHRIFEDLAQTHPDRIAIRSEEQSMSYADLNAKANQLARFLKKQGVKAGTHAGLFFERGEDLYIAILAVLKAGAVYIPFDVEYPKIRLRWMVKDSRPSLVLASSNLSNEVKETGLNALFLDQHKKGLKRFSKKNLPSNCSLDTPAYIMYTSGSTGRPKGVMVPHRGIVRLVKKPNYVKLSSKTRTLQLAPVSFDASTFEIWAPLLNGGCCVLYPERVPSLGQLDEIIKAESVNTLWLTASLFNFIIDTAPEILQGVSQLLVGGEALSPIHINKAQKQLPGTMLINGYGPTENTTFSCCYPIPRIHHAKIPVSIGPPISHSTAYVMDRGMRLLPTGVPGELYVGGQGVALGYLNNPDLTNEQFVQSPYATSGSATLYRTGDRVFQRGDGRIEYMERFDDQVKIRGYRIEPGEIQARILQLKEVKDGAVLIRKNQRKENELVAFVVLQPGVAMSQRHLKQRLSDQLPNYMVPAQIVFMSSLPLTTNGKINRTELLGHETSEDSLSGHSFRDLTITQRKLWDLWKEVLGQKPASLDEVFFDAGGHSLFATNLIYEIQSEFSLKLPFSIFNERPTVRTLSQWIDQQMLEDSNGKGNEPFIIKPVKVESVSELNQLWRTMYLSAIEDPESANSQVIVRSIILEGNLRPKLLIKAIEQVVNLHDILRTHAIKKDGKFYQKVEPEIKLEVPIIDLTKYPAKEAMRRAKTIFEKEWVSRVNMRNAPLFRSKLIKLEKQKYHLSMVFNHAIADGVSLELFYSQMSRAYNDFVKHRPVSLKPPNINFNEYHKNLENWLAKGNQQRITNYWKKMLMDLKPIDYPFLKKKLPRDPEWNVYDHYEILPEWSERVKHFTQTHSLSTYIFFTTIIKLLVARYTGEMDSYVASSLDCRAGPDQAELFGCISNSILVRTRLKKSKSFVEQAEAVRNALFQAQEYKYVSTRVISTELQNTDHAIYKRTGQLYVGMGPDTGDSLILQDIRSTFLPRKKRKAQYRLGITIREPADRILISFSSIPSIFIPCSIDRFKYNFQRFIKLLLENPNLLLKELPDLSTPDNYRKPLSKHEKEEFFLAPIGPEGRTDWSAIKVQESKSIGEPTIPFKNLEKTQQTVWQLWTELLGQKPRSLDEDFLEAGGDSLLATNFIYKIQSTFSLQIPFSIFEESATVRSISHWIDEQLAHSDSEDRHAPFVVEPIKVESISEMNVMWRNFYMSEIEDPANANSTIICRTIIMEGNLKSKLLEKALEHVVNMHDGLRMHAVKIGGKFFQKVEDKIKLEVPKIDLTGHPPEKAMLRAKAIFEKDWISRMNMRDAPLFKAKIIKLEKLKHILSLAFHHATTDGVSIDMFFRQISHVYNDLVNKRPITLKSSKINFRQFDKSLANWLAKGNGQRMTEFWEKMLREIKPVKLPFLVKKLPDQVDWNTFDHYEFSPELTARIKRFTETHSLSTYIFFTTIVKLMIARYTGEMDSYVASGVDFRAGPEQAEIFGSPIGGMLVRNRLKKTRSFLEHAKSAREALYVSQENKYVSPRCAAQFQGDTSHKIHRLTGHIQVAMGPDTDDSIYLEGIKSTLIPRYNAPALYRLGFIVRELKDRLQIIFRYVPSFCVPHSIDRVKYNFQRFIKLILENPNLLLNELPDLSTPDNYRKPLSKHEKEEFFLAPIGPDGKTDWAAIKAQKPSIKGETTFSFGNVGRTQQTVWHLWTKVLGQEPESLDDNFFRAGEHSLLATNLIYEIQSTFSLRVPFCIFQERSTVRSLS
ncbi:MAG: amino acid adenylation domain-containing protein, partial [Verrucomicrobia bacterium]|nr:amino acid adenylation domain-containing protein [Verrucomicrobiota bacterium]